MKKLSWKVILGYGTASASDAITYNFVFMFLLFFLTDIAGISPALAGSISLIAVIWDAVSTPILGQISDNTRSKYGRRRPYLVAVAVPLAAAFVLLFTDIPLEGNAKNVYYVIMAMVFWTSYTTFYIPYTALGAELTLDYDERTKLRAPATIFNLLGNIIGMSAPSLVVAMFIGQGMAPGRAWQSMAMIAGGIAMICVLITWRSTRGHEIMDVREEEFAEKNKENGFKTYLKILKLKPYKFLLGMFMFFMFGYSMINADVTYFVYHKMQSTEETLALVMFLYILIGIVAVPLVSGISMKIGKQKAAALCIAGSGVLMFCFKFLSIESFGMLLVYMAIFSIANGAYWTLIPAISMDMCEVYEYKYGERREGAVFAAGIFFAKFSAAIASQVLGIILSVSGYDPALPEQAASAVAGIENAFTIIPSSFLILSGLMALAFPLTKAKFDQLKKVMEAKKNGTESSTEGLERII